MKRLRIVFLLLIAVTVLAACAGGDERTVPSFSLIAPEEFPTALGAGFPMVQVKDASTVSVEVGQTAPNFAFVWEDGQGADLASLQGRPVIVNFWATWCGPCRAEMPELVAMHNVASDLVVLEVNTQESLAAVQPFAQEFGMTMPVLLDEAGALRKLYGVRSMPTTLFINRQGIVTARWAGLLTGDQLSQFVTQIKMN